MATLLQPASTLDEVYQTLSPEPLLGDEEFNAFYGPELNAVRGGDKVARIELRLRRGYGGSHYRAFLMGHSGVGKSTELSRLIRQTQAQFRAIRFSAVRDLNPAGFKPFDVLLIMLIRLMEETEKCGGGQPSEKLLSDVRDWFANKTQTYRQTSSASQEATAEAGVAAPALLAGILKLGVNLKSALKFATDRETKVEAYELSLIPELITLVNRLLDECNAISRATHGQEWLFIGEDFDKSGIPAAQTEDLFLNFGNIFHELRTHVIFTIPINLVYSDRMVRLPFGGDRIETIYDIPVFKPDHQPDENGRAAVAAILARRLSPGLFEDGQMTRLIVASGGNLRDLFKMTGDAADTALLRTPPSPKISKADADVAINSLRAEYLRRLGESIFDETQTGLIPYDQKATRLLEVYNNASKDIVSDATLYALLRARAVQEFNGEGWFGVQPLVVDILGRQERLLRNAEGKLAGGTA